MRKKLPYIFPGRFQPFHFGHESIVRKLLKEGENVCIALRDTGVNKNNPYSYEDRKEIIEDVFKKEVKEGRLEVIKIRDFKGIVYGRDVGYDVREVRLNEDIESISGTNIRNEKSKEI